MGGQLATWVDGEPAAALPLPDRGLDFGDGLFETILVRRGVPLFIELHLQRLALGLNTLRFPDCLAQVRRHLDCALPTLAGQDWCALRVTATRGSGPRGYVPPQQVRPRVVISASSIERDCTVMPPAATLQLASLNLSQQPALAGLKHLNRLEQVLAASEARELGCDEVLLCDQQGRAICVSAGNLFLVREGRLLTPRLDGCGVAGTRRRLVMEQWAPQLGLAVLEEDLTPADFTAADEVFYSNSLLGLRPVAALGARRWNNHAMCESLHRCLVDSLP